MNTRGAGMVLALCLFVAGQPAVYAADGWFGSSTGSSSSSSAATKKSTKSSWFSWPSSKPKSSARSQPSMFQKMTRSTKDSWNKTVSFLNPFDNPPAPKKKPAVSEPNTGNWFPSRQPPKEPTSVPEWLGGEMPRF